MVRFAGPAPGLPETPELEPPGPARLPAVADTEGKIVLLGYAHGLVAAAEIP